MIQVKLRLYTEPCHPYAHNWVLTSKRLFVTSNHLDGYSTKSNAKRAALRFAEQLGLTITETEDET